MTPQAHLRRIGWFAMLIVFVALYCGLHLKVQSVKSDVVRAERRIVELQDHNLLLETEFLTRSSQLQLAQWNRVDFGYTAPEASQFIAGRRQLAALGGSRVPGSTADVRLASYSPGEDVAAAAADQADGADKAVPAPGPGPAPGPRGIIPASLAVNDRAVDDRAGPAPRLALIVPQANARTRIQLTALADAAIP